MIDFYAAIREHIEQRPRIETWHLTPGTVGADVGRWIELAAEMLTADLDLHRPDYYGGRAEYEERTEEAFDRNGKPLGAHVVVRSEIPNPPDWCDECCVRTPCRHIRQLAARLGIYQWLTADDPEPDYGTLVVNAAGDHWFRVPWLGEIAWLLADENGQPSGDPCTWATVAGDHGPVRNPELT